MSRRAAVLGMALLLAALSPAAPATAALSIPLTVQEPGAAARVAEPVTSGVPLPPGTQATSWALFDGSREIPVQVTKLRGRVPWILLDFQLDIGSGRSKALTLKEQAPQPAAADLAPTAPPGDEFRDPARDGRTLGRRAAQECPRCSAPRATARAICCS